MSKNVVIQEGGVGKQLTANKLKTNLVGGGTCLWVPEDETQLGTKYISENGTYKASNDGYYGYSEVTVSGIGSVTGKDPDGSGDDATATIDPETGEITINKVPSRIEVITPPTNPYGVYADGQTIETDGMVVKAYLESGGEYGTVPNGEITINPTTAVYDESKDEGGIVDYETDDDIRPWPSHFSSSGSVSIESKITGKMSDSYEVTGSMAVLEYSRNNYLMIVASPNSGAVGVHKYDLDTTNPKSTTLNTNNSYTQNGKTVYMWAGAFGINPDLQEVQLLANQPVSGSASDADGRVAWTMLYGHGTPRPAGSLQTIAVYWPRPGDGKVLETTFEILVAPPYSPDDN